MHNDVIKAQQQGRDIHVVILDAHRDGIEQINEALASFNKLDAVHIVSHGDDGQLQLGATQLNQTTLRDRTSEISSWKQAFSDDGDLLIYGCNLAETADGKTLVNQLSQLTATDVAASDDLTGNNLLGGDWELEYEAGEIETEIAFSEHVQDDWQGTLDAAAQAAAEEQKAAEEQRQQQQEQQAQAELEAQQAVLQEEEQAAAKQEEGDQQAAITQEQRQEIVIIDESVADFQTFIDDLQSSSDPSTTFEIVLLDNNSDGVERINEILSKYNDVDALHMISHGDDGTVKLGDTWLNADNLDQYSDSLSAWGNALDVNADLLIYGCNLAESTQGETFINQLAQITGADVAASDDLTGHASLGGDWDLEYQAGEVETAVARFSRPSQAACLSLLIATDGGNVLVNETTTDVQKNVDVGLFTDSSYVAVWDSLNDGSGEGVYLRILNADGSEKVTETLINQTTLNQQVNPSVAVSSNGNFVVSWTSTQDGSKDIYARIYDSNGTALTNEFLVNTGYTIGEQWRSDVAIDDSGNFVAVSYTHLRAHET